MGRELDSGIKQKLSLGGLLEYITVNDIKGEMFRGCSDTQHRISGLEDYVQVDDLGNIKLSDVFSDDVYFEVWATKNNVFDKLMIVSKNSDGSMSVDYVESKSVNSLLNTNYYNKILKIYALSIVYEDTYHSIWSHDEE